MRWAMALRPIFRRMADKYPATYNYAIKNDMSSIYTLHYKYTYSVIVVRSPRSL